MLLRPYRDGNRFRNFTVYRDGCVRTDDGADSTPRAAVLERVRGVVAFGGKPRHVQLHHLLWTCTDAKFAAFTVCITDFDPTFCRHHFSLSEKFDHEPDNFHPDYVLLLV